MFTSISLTGSTRLKKVILSHGSIKWVSTWKLLIISISWSFLQNQCKSFRRLSFYLIIFLYRRSNKVKIQVLVCLCSLRHSLIKRSLHFQNIIVTFQRFQMLVLMCSLCFLVGAHFIWWSSLWSKYSCWVSEWLFRTTVLLFGHSSSGWATVFSVSLFMGQVFTFALSFQLFGLEFSK